MAVGKAVMLRAGTDGCDHEITCASCHQRSRREDLYAKGYEKGWRDALAQVRRLARMNPWLRPERADNLLRVLLRYEHMLRVKV